MEEKYLHKQKNSNHSILLILLNTFLVYIFVNANFITGNQQKGNIVWLSIAFTILLGGYAFNYHGKGYRIAKWLFAISLLIGIGLLGLLFYSAGLGKAFSH